MNSDYSASKTLLISLPFFFCEVKALHMMDTMRCNRLIKKERTRMHLVRNSDVSITPYRHYYMINPFHKTFSQIKGQNLTKRQRYPFFFIFSCKRLFF